MRRDGLAQVLFFAVIVAGCSSSGSTKSADTSKSDAAVSDASTSDKPDNSHPDDGMKPSDAGIKAGSASKPSTGHNTPADASTPAAKPSQHATDAGSDTKPDSDATKDAATSAMLDASTQPSDAAMSSGGGGDTTKSDAAPAAMSNDAAVSSPPSVIYVSQTSGDDAKDGTSSDSPVLSITRAVALAGACLPTPCEVHVAAGTYMEAHTLTLIGGVNILGGYTADAWKHTLGASATTIQTADLVTIKADTLSLPTVLDKLTIQANNATAPGAASFAVQVSNNNNLAITNSIIIAGNGARGTDGSNGGTLSCNAPGGAGGVASDCNSGNGSDGVSTTGAPAGIGGTGGGSNCPDSCPNTGSDGVSNGNGGSSGSNGGPGSPGAQVADGFGRFVGLNWTPANGSSGSGGTPGTGGGGSDGTKRIRACFGCDTLLGVSGNKGGDGACPGGGGNGGQQGGGSFAVIAYNATVDLTGTKITRGNGGDGGNGGRGADGQPPPNLPAQQDAVSVTCGAIGYRAGNGAQGGQGGGAGGSAGNGGPSVGVVLIGSASTVTGSPTISGGTPGNPGTPGGGGVNHVITTYGDTLNCFNTTTDPVGQMQCLAALGTNGNAPSGTAGVTGTVSESCGGGPGC